MLGCRNGFVDLRKPQVTESSSTEYLWSAYILKGGLLATHGQIESAVITISTFFASDMIVGYQKRAPRVEDLVRWERSSTAGI